MFFDNKSTQKKERCDEKCHKNAVKTVSFVETKFQSSVDDSGGNIIPNFLLF